MNEEQQLWISYKKIQAKLNKKRFIKKPNYNAAIESFSPILTNLRRDEHYTYEAFCILSVARCEEAIKNFSGAAESYFKAGHLLWQESEDLNALESIHVEENIQEAINCYLLAIKIYTDQKRLTLVASLYFEMATILKNLGKYSDACEFYEKSTDIYQKTSQLNGITALQMAVECRVKLHFNIYSLLKKKDDYKKAFTLCNWIIKLSSESADFYDIDDFQVPELSNFEPSSTSIHACKLLETRISYILLLLIQGEFDQALDYVSKLKQDANHNHYGIQNMGLNLNLNQNIVVDLFMQLVNSCKNKNLSQLYDLKDQMNDILTDIQKEWLCLIIEVNKNQLQN